MFQAVGLPVLKISESEAATKTKPWLGVLVIVLLCGWMAFHTPTPREFIGDSDMGVQASGAQQIAAGEHPFIGWRSTYGPSRFYASYLAQLIGHHRMGSEIVLCQLAYVLAYWLMFGSIRKLTRSTLGAAVMTAVGCLLLPRVHKYFIVLGPMWTLYFSLGYSHRPQWRRLLLISLGITITALYRIDFGVWTLLAGAAAVMLADPKKGSGVFNGVQSFARLGALLAGVIAFASPWLIFLFIHGALRNFFHEATITGVALAEGLALPFPRYDPRLPRFGPDNLLALGYLGEYLLFAISILFIGSRWRTITRELKNQLTIVLILTTCGLMQSFYRSDCAHLLQAIFTSHVLAAFVLVESLRQFSVRKFQTLFPAAFVVAVYAITISAGFSIGAIGLSDTEGISSWKWFYSKSPRAGMAEALLHYPKDPFVQMVERVREIVKPGERIFCVPYSTSVYFLTQHLFAAGQLYLAPGYFNDEAGQSAMIDALRRQGLPPIIEEVGAEYDQRPDRSSRAIAPKVFEFIEANYSRDATARMPKEYAIWKARNAP